MSKQIPTPGKKLTQIASGKDVAAAKKQEAAIAKVKAKERERALRLEAEQPKKQFKNGEEVVISGSAKVNDEDVHGQRVSTDHRGARAKIGTSYFSPERQEHVHVTQTEDGEIRAVPESHLQRKGSRISTTVPKTDLYPSFISVAMNPAFCGERCNYWKHCLDDHSMNGDPEA